MRSCTPAYKWSSRGFLPLSRSVVRVASARLVPLFLCFFCFPILIIFPFLYFSFLQYFLSQVFFSVSSCLLVSLFFCFYHYLRFLFDLFLSPSNFLNHFFFMSYLSLSHLFSHSSFFLSLSAWTCNRKSVHTSPAADMSANERDSEKSWSLTTEQVWDTERGEREQAAQRGGRSERDED